MADQSPTHTRAEALFEKAKKATQKLHDSEALATRQKTERLRALRLAKEAADKGGEA